MADPRSFTVKQCAPAYAQKSGAAIAAATTARRDFFGSVGKVGDLAVLNDIGGGKIGAGLRTVASISNSIRTGCGSIPTSIGSTLESGANWILEQTGLAPTAINALEKFNPSIANQAYGQAKSIFDQVSKGRFTFNSIPGVIQDLTNFERLASGIFTPGRFDVQSGASEHCEASPYAYDLIARAPKYKFLFVVQFIPEAGYSELGSNEGGPLDMAFTVKRTTRPNAKFVQEDVNYYNFRSKYHTKTIFDEMTMSFSDDVLSYTMGFYQACLKAMAPIANVAPTDSSILEESGMAFANNTLQSRAILNRVAGNRYAATKGLMAGDAKQIFREIRLYHVFDNGHKMDVHRFMNPKLTSLALDDLDMSVGNEGTELSLSFAYDSVFIETMSVDPKKNGGAYDIAGLQRGATYILRYNDGTPSAEMPRVTNTPQPFSGNGSPGSCDPLNTVGGALGAASKTVSAVTDLASKFSGAVGGLFG